MISDFILSFWAVSGDFFTILGATILAGGVMIGIAEAFGPLIRRL